MQIYVQSQWIFLANSLLCGFFIGIIYDIMCLIPYSSSTKKRYNFFADTAFVIIASCIISAVTYSSNYGTYRVYSFLAAAVSFALYRISFGKLIFVIEIKIFEFTKKLIKYICKKFYNILDFSIKFVKIKLRIYQINKYMRNLMLDAQRGFARKDRNGRVAKSKQKSKA